VSFIISTAQAEKHNCSQHINHTASYKTGRTWYFSRVTDSVWRK